MSTEQILAVALLGAVCFLLGMVYGGKIATDAMKREFERAELEDRASRLRRRG